jgi:hypothetical protein
MNNTSIRDLARNLKVRSILSYNSTDPEHIYIDTHKVNATADEIILQNQLGSPVRAVAVDVTIDITASGLNGLDSGIEYSSTWYHIWIIANSKGMVKGLLSLSASGPAMPKGYAYKAYVGAIYNNCDGVFITYYQNGKLVWAEKSCPLAMTEFPNDPTNVDYRAIWSHDHRWAFPFKCICRTDC